MWYWTKYYVKKYWYLILLILVLILVVMAVLNNSGLNLVDVFEKFNNKVSIEDSTLPTGGGSGSSLDGLDVDDPSIGSYEGLFIPEAIPESEKPHYVEELKKDPEFMYKKKISWAYGTVTNDQFNELVELIEYHLGKDSTEYTYVVTPQSPEQMSSAGNEVYFYTDDDGVLYLNLSVSEVEESSGNITQTYAQTFELKYDLDGYVNIS